MAKRTKKVGSAGRFGARYGVTVRKRIAEVEVECKGRHECPVCHGVTMGRTATGIWVCRRCDTRMASSSYKPTPPVAVRRELAEVLAKAEGREEAAGVEEEESEVIPAKEPKKAEKPKKSAKKKE